MVIKRARAVAPVELIALVADREIEHGELLFDRMAHELMQMHGAGAEPRELAVGVARQHVIIVAAESEREISRDDLRSDLKLADMGEPRRLRVAREIPEELDIARPRKQIGDAALREKGRFLFDQDRKHLEHAARRRGRHEFYLAKLGEPIALGAVAPPGRR